MYFCFYIFCFLLVNYTKMQLILPFTDSFRKLFHNHWLQLRRHKEKVSHKCLILNTSRRRQFRIDTNCIRNSFIRFSFLLLFLLRISFFSIIFFSFQFFSALTSFSFRRKRVDSLFDWLQFYAFPFNFSVTFFYSFSIVLSGQRAILFRVCSSGLLLCEKSSFTHVDGNKKWREREKKSGRKKCSMNGEPRKIE